MDYENPWLWNGTPFREEHIGNSFGFVYIIQNKITNKKYIGKKFFYSTNRVVQKGKTRRKVIRKFSDWKKYYGSSKSLKEDVELYGKGSFSRTILSLHVSRGDVNYYEMKEQVIRDVLNSEEYYNDNILSRWYRKKNKTVSLFSIQE